MKRIDFPPIGEPIAIPTGLGCLVLGSMAIILFLSLFFGAKSYESGRKSKTRMQERYEKRIVWEKNNYFLPKDTAKIKAIQKEISEVENGIITD